VVLGRYQGYTYGHFLMVAMTIIDTATHTCFGERRKRDFAHLKQWLSEAASRQTGQNPVKRTFCLMDWIS